MEPTCQDCCRYISKCVCPKAQSVNECAMSDRDVGPMERDRERLSKILEANRELERRNNKLEEENRAIRGELNDCWRKLDVAQHERRVAVDFATMLAAGQAPKGSRP